jgi:hypothetical protein
MDCPVGRAGQQHRKADHQHQARKQRPTRPPPPVDSAHPVSHHGPKRNRSSGAGEGQRGDDAGAGQAPSWRSVRGPVTDP